MLLQNYSVYQITQRQIQWNSQSYNQLPLTGNYKTYKFERVSLNNKQISQSTSLIHKSSVNTTINYLNMFIVIIFIIIIIIIIIEINIFK